jgi:hypothetical protein
MMIYDVITSPEKEKRSTYHSSRDAKHRFYHSSRDANHRFY